MNHREVLAVFDRELRREAAADGPGTEVERDGDVVRQVGPEDGWNGVLWSGLRSGADADAAIAAQVRHFGALGRPFEWKVYGHDRPADLGGRLLAAGFEAEPEETLMVARAADVPAAPVPDGIRLVPVTDQDGVELVADVHEVAFGAARVRIRERLLAQLAAGTVVAAVAMAGDVPVSAARMDLHPGTRFAGLWGGGTVPQWRGRGVYRALVAYRAGEAVARGYEYLQVDASDQSRPILLRLGFAALTTTTPYVHP
ncbi:GNAT family N-acetyltransferase [Nonomuraea gerenzanensis]|uniref:Acetyltransferase n=1 Tax=Nonomuraea gerenzanensis TaxID=93944 RepID=A0A1M4EF98_9ACTN|nr:GNAT family N-acetyltransferase [Nonomuraea gerenzanensis]UBU08884.1 GNAT family N-acetyltransferase [Nonomuraea gerenzanensis]SBO97253.1 acetyltransferase [Nonomuraea gerenzanensis]